MRTTTADATKTKKALIIEDEADMCLLLNIMLNDKDIDLEHVKNIQAAKEYLQKEQPAVVILDNKLPDGYGVDFIGFIRHNYPAIRIIMISGFDASAEDVALENGADVFLQKPFTKQQVFDAMMRLLK